MAVMATLLLAVLRSAGTTVRLGGIHAGCIALFVACGTPGEGGGDDQVPVIGEPSNVVLNDTSEGINITITDGAAAGWLFGNIYPDSSDFGEACLDDGDVCHELDSDGGTLAWCDRGDEDCTSMAQLYWRTGEGSYVLIPTVGLGCFAWGDDADHWDALGCTVTSWDPSSY